MLSGVRGPRVPPGSTILWIPQPLGHCPKAHGSSDPSIHPPPGYNRSSLEKNPFGENILTIRGAGGQSLDPPPLDPWPRIHSTPRFTAPWNHQFLTSLAPRSTRPWTPLTPGPTRPQIHCSLNPLLLDPPLLTHSLEPLPPSSPSLDPRPCIH